jgi:hypothetical protein
MSATLLTGAIVDGPTLAKAAIYSLVAGVGLATAFGAGVTSAAGLLEAVRSKRTGLAIAWGTAAVLFSAIVLGGVAAGIFVMIKG